MQNRNRWIFLLLIAMLSLQSCLKSGLDDLPKFQEAMITDVFSEYRFEDPTATSGGSPVVRIQTLAVSDKEFKLKEATGAETDSAVFSITVPAASDNFTTTVRDQVTASNIVFMCNISTGSAMEPLEGSPRSGAPGDFTQARKYKVTAADGTVRIWTVRLLNFYK